jgi:alpha-L-rhamnosidase
MNPTMRNLFNSLIAVLCLNGALAADRPWLQIMVPSAAEAAAGFESPSPENGMTLWWGWDGPVNEQVIKRDLDRIKAMGFAGVMIEAGNRMEQKYLSPGWFNLFKVAVDEAKARNMRVWVEDEGKYPSGFVGGRFTQERPDLCMQALADGEQIDVAAGATVTRKLGPETICAVACNLANNENKVLGIRDGIVRFTAPAHGKWQIWTTRHVFRSGATAWVDNPTGARKDTAASLCDYMNPEATQKILEWTYEGYRKAVGEECGKTFMGLMSDEPAFTGTPWTPAMLDEFQKRKGYDARRYLAWIAGSGTLPEDARRAKSDYWDVWSDLFGENYFSRLSAWCRANNLEYICHLDKDDSNPTFVRTGGDYFKAMRNVGIPGIDVIWAQIWFDHEADYPKLASSAAHLFGKPHAFTESFAAFTNPVDVPTAKWVIDYQLVRGINMVTAMAMSASSGGRGGGPNAAPRRTVGSGQALSSGTNAAATATTNAVAGARRAARGGGGAAPAVPHGPRYYTMPGFPAVAKYVHRASYLLSLGTPAAQIGVLLPTTSLWLGDTASDKSNQAIAQKLLETQRDFDWVDERSLASVLKLEGNELKNLSGQSYRAIVVPSLTVISQAALDRLQAFARAGGRVIFLGRTPTMVIEKTFLMAAGAPDLKWALVESSGEFTLRVIKALPKPDVTLDQPCATMKYQHRSWRDADLYFFFNEGTEKQSCLALLTGNGQAQIWDATAGRIEVLGGASSANGTVTVPLTLEPHGSLFIVVGARSIP